MITIRARYMLVHLAKLLPFAFCFVVCIGYCESFIALLRQDFALYHDEIVLTTPLSWMIGNWYMYGLFTIIALAILALAMETCIWNRLAVLYLALHLLFKNYIESIELYEYQVYLLCVVNIIITTTLIVKGIKTWKGGTIKNG